MEQYGQIPFEIFNDLQVQIQNKIDIHSDLIRYLLEAFDQSKHLENHKIYMEIMLYHIFFAIHSTFDDYQKIKYLMDFYFLEKKTLTEANQFESESMIEVVNLYRNLKIK